jgi:hypothetical protein
VKASKDKNSNGNGKLHLTDAAQQLRDLARECTGSSIQLRQVALGAIETLLACSDLLTSDTVDDLKDCHRMVSEEMAAIREENAEQEQAKTALPVNQPSIESEMDIEFIEKWKREIKDYDVIVKNVDAQLRYYNPLLQKVILMDLYRKLPELIKKQEDEQRTDAAEGALLDAVSDWPVEKVEQLARTVNNIKIPAAA